MREKNQYPLQISMFHINPRRESAADDQIVYDKYLTIFNMIVFASSTKCCAVANDTRPLESFAQIDMYIHQSVSITLRPHSHINC